MHVLTVTVQSLVDVTAYVLVVLNAVLGVSVKLVDGNVVGGDDDSCGVVDGM